MLSPCLRMQRCISTQRHAGFNTIPLSEHQERHPQACIMCQRVRHKALYRPSKLSTAVTLTSCPRSCQLHWHNSCKVAETHHAPAVACPICSAQASPSCAESSRRAGAKPMQGWCAQASPLGCPGVLQHPLLQAARCCTGKHQLQNS